MALSRADHLQWCKDRALEYAERGELNDAFASFWSDIKKHPETDLAAKNGTIDGTAALFFLGIAILRDRDKKQMIEYINGFR